VDDVTYFLFVNRDWRHADEYETEDEARKAYREILDDGYENAHVVSVYAAPNRGLFEAHMSQSCRLVTAGIPLDHPFLSPLAAQVTP
jgi:hypothetical protein